MDQDFDELSGTDYHEEIEEVKALLDDAEDLDAFLFSAQIENTVRSTWRANPEGEDNYPTDMYGSALIALEETTGTPIEELLHDIVQYVNWRKDSDIPLFTIE